MKNFESFLSPQLNEFVAYRQGLGYSLKSLRSQLLIFDRYLNDTDADCNCLHPGFFLDMRAHLHMQAASVNAILATARIFFQFLIRRGYIEENPLHDIPMLQENTVVPFVFSPEQINHFLHALCQRLRKSPAQFLTDLALYLALLLMARCAMRISEPIKVLHHHYRKDDKTIYIEKTKFRKDRLIPVPRAVITEIENYLTVRQTLRKDDDNPYLLAGKNQRPLSDQQVRNMFHKTLEDLGLHQPRRVIGNVNFLPPTPHSFRHSFAVNTLIKIKERGQSPQKALPVLAAYMGHSEWKCTAVYLRVADAKTRNNLVDFTLWQRRKI